MNRPNSDTVPSAIRQALGAVFSSPNERDSNGEEANVVDGLAKIARAIQRLADVFENALPKKRRSHVRSSH